MNVGELKSALADIPDDTPVLIASDEEGNNFNNFTELSESYVHNDEPMEPIHPDDEDEYERDELHLCVVLWP